MSGVIADFDPCGCGPAGPARWTKVGTGTMILSGNNTYTGGTTITAGTLQLGNGGTTGSILGNVVNNATLAFNRSNAYQFDGVISGSGAVQQNGAGTTTLTAVNTYAGATTISAGALALSGAGSIANSSGVVGNAKFDISGHHRAAPRSRTCPAHAAWSTLGNQTLTLTNAAGTFAGVIGGNGGLVKQGSRAVHPVGRQHLYRCDHGRRRQSAGQWIGRKRASPCNPARRCRASARSAVWLPFSPAAPCRQAKARERSLSGH